MVRQDGCAVLADNDLPDRISIAAPVLRGAGEAAAALGV